MGEARWARPKPRMTSREVYDELWARRRARGIHTPPPLIVDPLDDEEPCAEGCRAETLMRVIQGPDLVGCLICVECATVYRRDTP